MAAINHQYIKFDKTNAKFFQGNTEQEQVKFLALGINGVDIAWSSGNLQLGSQVQFKNIADPTEAQDAATKAYVDQVAEGLDVKLSVRAGSTENLAATPSGSGVGKTLTANANGAFTIDNVTSWSLNQRVLLMDQTDPVDNGIYIVSNTGGAGYPWVLTRATDFDGSPTNEVTGGAFTFVEEGDTHSDCGFVVTEEGTITVDTEDIVWTQFSGAGTYSAGQGLDLNGGEFSVDIDSASTGTAQVGTSGLSLSVNGLRFAHKLGENLDVLSHEILSSTGPMVLRPNGDESFIAGNGATGAGTRAISIGYQAEATEDDTVAIGSSADAKGTSATAIGDSAEATFANTTAIGKSADATAAQATSLGAVAQATGSFATAIGYSSEASGSQSAALGNGSEASGLHAVALGNAATASSSTTIAVGDTSSASQSRAIAIGALSVASAQYALSIGYNSTASANGKYGIAIGNMSTASAYYTTAIGYNSKASEQTAIALGSDANSSAEGGVGIGYSSNVQNIDGTALGRGTSVTGDRAIALGSNATASFQEAVAIGDGATASDNAAIAIGDGVTASGGYSIAIGDGCSAQQTRAITIGAGGYVAGQYGAGFGYATYVTGQYSTALGPYTTVTHSHGTAIGPFSRTSANYDFVVAGKYVQTSSSAVNNAFRVEGQYADVHLGRYVDQDEVSADTNKLKFHTTLAQNQSHYVSLTAPSLNGVDVEFTLPGSTGSAGQFLQTDGAGVLSWSTLNTNTSLQLAYETGNTIVTDSANGDLAISGTEEVTIEQTGSLNSALSVLGSNASNSEALVDIDNQTATGMAVRIRQNSNTNIALSVTQYGNGQGIDLGMPAGNSQPGIRCAHVGTGRAASLINVNASTPTLDLKNTASGGKLLEFINSANDKISFKLPASVPTDYSWTLPDAQGGAGEFLTNDGSGVLSWASVDFTGGPGIDITSNVISVDLDSANADIDDGLRLEGAGNAGLLRVDFADGGFTNLTGSNIAKHKVVSISNDGNQTLALADKDDANLDVKEVGIATSLIANGATDGEVYVKDGALITFSGSPFTAGKAYYVKDDGDLTDDLTVGFTDDDHVLRVGYAAANNQLRMSREYIVKL